MCTMQNVKKYDRTIGLHPGVTEKTRDLKEGTAMKALFKKDYKVKGNGY